MSRSKLPQFGIVIAIGVAIGIAIFASQDDTDDSLGGTDYYVVFRSDEDRWSEPINMGEVVNTPGDGEFSPYVSPDGRYFFFMSTRLGAQERIPPALTWDYINAYRMMPEIGNAGIYWVDAALIEELRPEGF